MSVDGMLVMIPVFKMSLFIRKDVIEVIGIGASKSVAPRAGLVVDVAPAAGIFSRGRRPPERYVAWALPART